MCLEAFLIGLVLLLVSISQTELSFLEGPEKKCDDVSLTEQADRSASFISLCAKPDSTLNYIFIIARPTQFLTPKIHQVSLAQSGDQAISRNAVNKKEAIASYKVQHTGCLDYRKQIDRA